MNPNRHYFAAAALREVDQRAMALDDPDGLVLMQRAAEAAFALARGHWPEARRWAIFCGPGNNGGDGFVLARLALEAGIDVALWHLPARSTAPAAAMQAQLDAEALGIIAHYPDAVALDIELATFAPDLLIDALFGIGLSQAPEGVAVALIRAINAHPAPCLALDVPSGLDADRGSAPGDAVQATVTVSFIAAKPGCATGRGRALCGTRIEAALDLIDPLFEGIQPAAQRFDAADGVGLLPARALDIGKQDCGHVLLIGGDHGMGGAMGLAAEAALRTGVGRLSAWTRAEHLPMLLARRPEAMARAVDSFEPSAVPASVNVLALGPGLGRADWARAAMQFALADPRPLLLDADALNVLAEQAEPGWPAERVVVLTPHAGEAGRLLGIERVAVEADRFQAAQELAQRYRAVVVLKGAGSLVCAPNRLPRVIEAGNPGMASGGMGDALSGVIAALLAQGLSAFDAAAVGSCIHAMAADAAAEQDGPRGLLASDLMPWIRQFANPGLNKNPAPQGDKP